MTSTVSSILARKGHRVVTARSYQTIASIADLLTTNRIGAVPIVDAAGEVVGMVSERDIVRGMSQYGAAAPQVAVSTLMSANISTCAPDDTIDSLMEVMTERRIRHLPVMRNDRLDGMISIGDLVKQRLEDAQREVEDLRSYIAS